MKYRPEIDGLRALAVVPVVLFHAGFAPFSGGFIGVDVFFVISGYLITSILIAELAADKFSILNFYDRRIRRIMPSLMVVILASFVAGWFILLPADFERFSVSAIAATTFWSNIFFWLESGYFDTETELKPLLHTWSLAVEEQFYIFFPIILAAIWRFGQRVILVVLGAIFAASLAVAVWDFGALSEPEAAFYLLPARAWELMLGAFAAFYLAHNGKVPDPKASGALSVIGIAMIAYSIFQFDKTTPFPSLYTLVPTIGTVLIILFERRGTWSFYILGNPAFVAIGLVSYSAYLWHQPLFAYARYISLDQPSQFLMALLIIATFALAWLSYKLVETPFRNRDLMPRARVFFLMSAAGLCVIVLGAAGWISQGAAGRYDLRHQLIFAQYDDPAAYVRARFTKLIGAEFDPNDPRRKLLIIGDSYGQDMVNAVAESALNDRYAISTFSIAASCGNLYLKRDFSNLIKEGDRALCAKRRGYDDADLQTRIKQADEIWLVSSWAMWQVDHLAESLENIRELSDVQIRVLGRKNLGFGQSLRRYWQEVAAGNEAMVMRMSTDHISVNDKMREILPADVFIDVSEMMCGSGPACVNKTPEGLLISYDGGHLTQAGAKLMGQRLADRIK